MGCLYGAEVCDLTGLYILSKTKSVFENQNDVGLYRDNGLRTLRNLSGPQIERVRKELIKMFKECGLSITAKTNLKAVQLLDIEHRGFNNEILQMRELSKYVWDLKRNNKKLHITWTIVCKVYGNTKRNFCRLCLKQKLLIIKLPTEDSSSNKRSADIKIKI